MSVISSHSSSYPASPFTTGVRSFSDPLPRRWRNRLRPGALFITSDTVTGDRLRYSASTLKLTGFGHSAPCIRVILVGPFVSIADINHKQPSLTTRYCPALAPARFGNIPATSKNIPARQIPGNTSASPANRPAATSLPAHTLSSRGSSDPNGTTPIPFTRYPA